MAFDCATVVMLFRVILLSQFSSSKRYFRLRNPVAGGAVWPYIAAVFRRGCRRTTAGENNTVTPWNSTIKYWKTMWKHSIIIQVQYSVF